MNEIINKNIKNLEVEIENRSLCDIADCGNLTISEAKTVSTNGYVEHLWDVINEQLIRWKEVRDMLNENENE